MPIEDTQRLSPDDFRSLVEQGPDLVAVLTPEGQLRYASPAVANALGYAPDQLAGQDALAFVHPDDAAELHDALGEALRGGRPAPRDLRVLHQDGSWRTLE